MIKIDFHIHTKTTKLDENKFAFDIAVLKKYVTNLAINAISITNHNTFDKNQYDLICQKLEPVVVFPGIELSLDSGHILVIAPIDKLIDFSNECQQIEEYFKTKDSISIDDFLKIFPNLNYYLLIPHYEKRPVISGNILERLKEHVFCGEVQSPKKFEYCIKDSNKLTPVIFSDFRHYDFDTDSPERKSFPLRQTFIDCVDLNLSTIKLALKDKTKVSLTPSKFEEDFVLLPDGTIASTGINVILGQRSSGKTFTLEMIRNSYDSETVKYIKQFSLVEGNDQERFLETIEREKSDFSDRYLYELRLIVDKISSIDLAADKTGIDDYVTSLVSYAKNQDKNDSFSRAKLFSVNMLPKDEINDLKKLIQATILLIENTNYGKIIEKHVSIEGLKKLFLDLNSLYVKKKLMNKIIDETNNAVVTISDILGKKAAITQPKDWDFIQYAKNKLFVDNFNNLITSLDNEKIILEQYVFSNFRIVGKCVKNKNVTDIKKQLPGIQLSRENLERYDTPYHLLKYVISENVLKSKNDAYKVFWRIEYDVLNAFGKPLSGGEKAEYNLLSKLKNSEKYELILIDEPESSFDNIFLKTNVIQLIKDLSRKSTVFLVTHNNNLGVLIQPNRLLYTEKKISEEGISYRIYSGNYDSKELVSSDGNKIPNFIVLLNTMEAGDDAYKERGKIYELIKNY